MKLLGKMVLGNPDRAKIKNPALGPDVVCSKISLDRFCERVKSPLSFLSSLCAAIHKNAYQTGDSCSTDNTSSEFMTEKDTYNTASNSSQTNNQAIMQPYSGTFYVSIKYFGFKILSVA